MSEVIVLQYIRYTTVMQTRPQLSDQEQEQERTYTSPKLLLNDSIKSCRFNVASGINIY